MKILAYLGLFLQSFLPVNPPSSLVSKERAESIVSEKVQEKFPYIEIEAKNIRQNNWWNLSLQQLASLEEALFPEGFFFEGTQYNVVNVRVSPMINQNRVIHVLSMEMEPKFSSASKILVALTLPTQDDRMYSLIFKMVLSEDNTAKSNIDIDSDRVQKIKIFFISQDKIHTIKTKLGFSTSQSLFATSNKKPLEYYTSSNILNEILNLNPKNFDFSGHQGLPNAYLLIKTFEGREITLPFDSGLLLMGDMSKSPEPLSTDPMSGVTSGTSVFCIF